MQAKPGSMPRCLTSLTIRESSLLVSNSTLQQTTRCLSQQGQLEARWSPELFTQVLDVSLPNDLKAGQVVPKGAGANDLQRHCGQGCIDTDRLGVFVPRSCSVWRVRCLLCWDAA